MNTLNRPSRPQMRRLLGAAAILSLSIWSTAGAQLQDQTARDEARRWCTRSAAMEGVAGIGREATTGGEGRSGPRRHGGTAGAATACSRPLGAEVERGPPLMGSPRASPSPPAITGPRRRTAKQRVLGTGEKALSGCRIRVVGAQSCASSLQRWHFGIIATGLVKSASRTS